MDKKIAFAVPEQARRLLFQTGGVIGERNIFFFVNILDDETLEVKMAPQSEAG